MFLESESGKKEDLSENAPTRPKITKAIITMFTAISYLIKYEMSFRMANRLKSSQVDF